MRNVIVVILCVFFSTPAMAKTVWRHSGASSRIFPTSIKAVDLPRDKRRKTELKYVRVKPGPIYIKIRRNPLQAIKARNDKKYLRARGETSWGFSEMKFRLHFPRRSNAKQFEFKWNIKGPGRSLRYMTVKVKYRNVSKLKQLKKISFCKKLYPPKKCAGRDEGFSGYPLEKNKQVEYIEIYSLSAAAAWSHQLLIDYCALRVR